ncbi:MAG: hypothetical protein H3C47_07010 [Candidatus Cloacimonetes bacterium]|nr:hypothetical protein [Candidatus Cloacimonadota bacterium]
MNGKHIVAVVAIVAVFSVPLTFLLSPFAAALIPLAYIAASVGGVRYLLGYHHKQKQLALDKQIELERISLEHVRSADQLLEGPDFKSSKKE